MFSFNSPIETLPRIGTKTGRDFKKLGLLTVKDLLLHFPFRHEDFSQIKKTAELQINEQASTMVQVLMVENRKTHRTRRVITEAIFQDDSGSIKAIWFNGRYIANFLKPGDWVYLSGKLEKSYFGIHMINPIFERAVPGRQTVHAGCLVPIYRTAGRLSPRMIRNAVAEVIHLCDRLPDWLPESIINNRRLPNFSKALRDIHFPKDTKALALARRRLSYNELFIAGLVAQKIRAKLDATPAPQIPFQETETKKFVDSLPFTLTNDQKKSAWKILQDMKRPRPMNRLLEGEVGSGKTVVAAIATLNTALAGYQTVYLAPTEILAGQHAATFKKLLAGQKIKIALLTQSRHEINGNACRRQEIEDAARLGQTELIIGTHALLESKIDFFKPGLVIVDEQHRFGVEQRRKLRAKESPEGVPHLLSMTATPIPRTLALTAYGDLDSSILRELPKGRKPITTERLPSAERPAAYQHIRQEVKNGRQAFVICPLIEESDQLGVKAATKTFQELNENLLAGLRLGLLHGKLKSEQKEKVMTEFEKGNLDVLVATAVVEVGIDIPNATVMVIEGADRFGLAQLHQFRGRIGRGEFPSKCFVLSETETQDTLERLDVFAQNHDGFTLAEYDLKKRGPGEIFGDIQSGFSGFRIANIHDRELVEICHRDARALLATDPELKEYSYIKKRLAELEPKSHLE